MALGQAVSAGAKLAKKAVQDKTPALSATALATGVVATPEEAEAAYIPLQAFKQGTESAAEFFYKALDRLNQGADASPGGELYKEMGVFLAPDGNFKVDVPELRAKEIESALAVDTFREAVENFTEHSGSRLKRKKDFKMSDFLPANSPVFEYFPELKDVAVTLRHAKKDEAYTYGGYSPSNNDIEILLGAKNNTRSIQDAVAAFDTLVHEFQHATQNRFNVDGGGSPGSQLDTLKRLAKDYREATSSGDSERVEQLSRILDYRGSKASAEETVKLIEAGRIPVTLKFESYARGLGESEARSAGFKGLMRDETRADIGIMYPDSGQTARTFDTDVLRDKTKQIPQDEILVGTNPSEFEGTMGAFAERSAVDPKTNMAKGATAAAALAALNAMAEPVEDPARFRPAPAVEPVDEFSNIGRDVNTPPPKTPINYDGTVTSDVAEQLGLDPMALGLTPIVGEALGAADVVQMVGEANKQGPVMSAPEMYDEFSDIPRGLAADPLLEEAKRQSRAK